PIIRELKLNLRRFVSELLASNLQATEEVGLNSADIGSLCLILLNGPTPAGRLAEMTGLTTGAVTGLVDRLEKAGFVRRELDSAARRKVIVTPAAARVERELFPQFSSLKPAASAKFYDAYSVAELELIPHFLRQLNSD